MPKKCDNKSVAVIVQNEKGEILLISRKEYNPGFAFPAGHQDGDDPEKTAKKELFEEVGLTALYLRPRLIKTLQNTCKREGGTFHRWTVFIAKRFEGEIKPSEREVKSAIWAGKEKILELAKKLEIFMEKNNLSVSDLPALVKATNESEDWKRDLGLEPPMYVLFKDMKII